MKSLLQETGEFSLVSPLGERSRLALCWASTSLSQLADGMTYYSCHDFSKEQVQDLPLYYYDFGGPRGI